MQHRILSTIIATALSIAVCAQETCTIKGNIANTQLNDGSKVKSFASPVPMSSARPSKSPKPR